VRVANVVGLCAQQAGEYRVEGAHPQVSGIASHHRLHPMPHFLGGLVGEGERHDVERIHVMGPDQVGDAVGEHAGLARAGTGDEHTGAFGIDNPLTLRVIEIFEIIGHRGGPQSNEFGCAPVPPVEEINTCFGLSRWSVIFTCKPSLMIKVGEVLVSDDIADVEFVCNLEKCKGACCVEGDLGAPLEADELEVMKKITPKVLPYLSEAGQAAIREQGSYILDEDGDYSTPTIGGRECAFAIYDDKKVLKCGIEQAYLDGKIKFRKPISCHLYPIRITKKKDLEAVNYHKWSICSEACKLGRSLQVPLYKFLKDPLIRKYGADWYEALVQAIENPGKK